MYKSFPFYSSHSLSAELEVGICYLELPLNRVDPAGIHGNASRWREGGDADLSVGCQVLNNGAPLHAVEAETSGAASYDEQRVAFFYGEALGLPVRVRDLSRDSLLVFTVRDGAGAIVAAASLPVFDARGVFRGGLQKLALHDDAEAAEAELEAAHASAEVGGRLGAFHGELRGDAEAEGGYKRYAPHDHLFRAEVFREGFGGEHGSILDEREDWLDDLALKRIGEQRADVHVVIMGLVLGCSNHRCMDLGDQCGLLFLVAFAQIIVRMTMMLGGLPTRHDVGVALEDVIRILAFEAIEHRGIAVQVIEIFQ